METADHSTTDGQQVNPEQWLDQYGDYLYRYAMSRLHDPEEAEEAVQETFVAGLRHRDQYRGQGSERAWLLGILKRKVIDCVRRRNRSGQQQTSEASDITEALFDSRGNWRSDPRMAAVSPEELVSRQQFWEALHACLGRLPPRQADVFTLRELDGLSSDDICRLLDISYSNLGVLLHRARLGLSDCLKRKLGE